MKPSASWRPREGSIKLGRKSPYGGVNCVLLALTQEQRHREKGEHLNRRAEKGGNPFCLCPALSVKYGARSLPESAGRETIGAPEKRQEGGGELSSGIK